MVRHNLVTVVPKDILIRILALIASDSTTDLVKPLKHLRMILSTAMPNSLHSPSSHGVSALLPPSSSSDDRWLETVRYCRERVRSIIESLWVWTTIAEPQGRGCHCLTRNVVRYDGWEPKEEIELRFCAANGCPFCF
ncbi:unnamed protein product [Linum trigynum]|uniref:Uncharacterized protein n=1 Tax=Linum trigynum TaxID=586398 RepID=A0AAV2C808_9ROSI